MQNVKRKTTTQSSKYFKPLVIAFSFLIFVFHSISVFASSHLTNQPGIDFSIQDIVGIITGLACWFTRVALILIVVFVIFYGIKFMTAQGDPTKLGEAKKSFLWGLVGILVILGTYTIIATVANSLGLDYRLLPLVCSGF